MIDWLSLLVFLGTTVVVLVVFVLLERDNRRVAARVRDLGGPARPGLSWAEWARQALARLPLISTLAGLGDTQRAALRRRFLRAGIYTPQAPGLFLSVQVLLACLGGVLGLALGLVGLLSPSRALLAGVVLAAVGLLLPGLWLDRRVARRQGTLRRGLPDALDMLVLCLEGGVSLVAALQHVTAELHRAHPALAGEMEVVQHEMLLGKTAGEAVRAFAERSDLEEVHTLSSVLLQNEQFGVSVARALRIHADGMRLQRQQRAEEQAQKAAVKILFPTLLCIFPAVFLVVLGPAAFRIMAVFAGMK